MNTGIWLAVSKLWIVDRGLLVKHQDVLGLLQRSPVCIEKACSALFVPNPLITEHGEVGCAQHLVKGALCEKQHCAIRLDRPFHRLPQLRERQGSESNDGRRYPGNVLFVPTVSGSIHPTQKPVELCEYLIRTYTRPGELVADICAGSGTTAIAAINTERRFVCFETAPSFYAAASERIRAAQAVKSSSEKGV